MNRRSFFSRCLGALVAAPMIARVVPEPRLPAHVPETLPIIYPDRWETNPMPDWCGISVAMSMDTSGFERGMIEAEKGIEIVMACAARVHSRTGGAVQALSVS